MPKTLFLIAVLSATASCVVEDSDDEPVASERDSLTLSPAALQPLPASYLKSLTPWREEWHYPFPEVPTQRMVAASASRGLLLVDNALPEPVTKRQLHLFRTDGTWVATETVPAEIKPVALTEYRGKPLRALHGYGHEAEAFLLLSQDGWLTVWYREGDALKQGSDPIAPPPPPTGVTDRSFFDVDQAGDGTLYYLTEDDYPDGPTIGTVTRVTTSGAVARTREGIPGDDVGLCKPSALSVDETNGEVVVIGSYASPYLIVYDTSLTPRTWKRFLAKEGIAELEAFGGVVVASKLDCHGDESCPSGTWTTAIYRTSTTPNEWKLLGQRDLTTWGLAVEVPADAIGTGAAAKSFSFWRIGRQPGKTVKDDVRHRYRLEL
jgi:hypothetical protein